MSTYLVHYIPNNRILFYKSEFYSYLCHMTIE
nr:MAG TPA: hypothetical protein [Caudoviricetes sp.]